VQVIDFDVSSFQVLVQPLFILAHFFVVEFKLPKFLDLVVALSEFVELLIFLLESIVKRVYFFLGDSHFSLKRFQFKGCLGVTLLLKLQFGNGSF
jgi:hypothetical protein